MTYGRMKTTEPVLAAKVDAWLEQAREADTAEDAVKGANRLVGETPDWMVDNSDDWG